MKSARSSMTRQNKQYISHKAKPDERDDLDSRKEKEEGFKGDRSRKGDRKKKR